jgi:hypothetical protein
MIKELIPFLIIGMISATPTKLTAAPLVSALEKPLKSSDYFSFSITPDKDSVQIQASDINGKLTLGGKSLSNCAADGTNWKCKPAEALTAGDHELAVAGTPQISSVALEVNANNKNVLIPNIAAKPKTATVTGEIAADSDIEITLTANTAPGKAIAGSAFSNFFKLGSVNLGTCSETGFASNALVDSSVSIKCKTGGKLAVSDTPYTFSLQDAANKGSVESLTIATFGDVTVSAAAATTENNGKFLNLSILFFAFSILF